MNNLLANEANQTPSPLRIYYLKSDPLFKVNF